MEERQRFTILHEFAHTLFPDFCDYVAHHHTPAKKAPDPEREFENLCDIAAAEILMPLADFKASAHKMRMCCEGIQTIASEFKASPDAATHRLVELTTSVGCAAVFLTDQRGENGGSGPLWVKYCWRNALFKGFLHPGSLPPSSSVAVGCYRAGTAVSIAAKETWWIGGYPRTWLVQALKLPEIADNPEYPKVVALLLPSGYR
jgi:hypothetical protein